MKPKIHFMGGVMERSKVLISGEETENNKIGVLILNMYMKEQTLMPLRRQTYNKQEKLENYLFMNTVHCTSDLSVCMCVLCIGGEGTQ